MTPQEIANLFREDIEEWYESKRQPNGHMNTNVMNVALILVEHMGEQFPLNQDQYATKSQVRWIGGSRIAKILARHGEHRPFTKEGGRTSRGTLDMAHQLADLLNESPAAPDYKSLPPDDWGYVRDRVQEWLVGKVRADYFDQRRIEADLDPGKPLRYAVASLLRAAKERGGNTAGAVAQHLVGAKLSLRFPDETISNESYTTADQQTARPGDFLVGDTAFHVTLSPAPALLANRCVDNIRQGYRSRVIVPDDRVSAALQMADLAGIAGQVAVSSIEEFVGTNIEEISVFTADRIRSSLRDLLERYNERVHAVEPDPSLQIEIPGNL